MNKPRLAMLAPISWRVPPRHYGPWELVVSLLVEELVRRGADVTLFATGDSLTSATLAGVCPHPYSEDSSIDPKVWECLHISELFERADEFDLIHNHFDFLPLTYSKLVRTPVLATIHGFSSERIVPVYKKYNRHAHYVAISEADRHPELDYIATIHHGIDIAQFDFCDKPEDYLLFFGRISPEKGTADAVRIALKTGRRLIIAGIIQDQDYFDREVAPHLGGGIEFIGPVGPARRSELLGHASALLHLIHFEEPFGLSVVESMACGTPVIAFPRGSMRELIEHGKTGCLPGGLDAAIAALDDIPGLDRRAIRATAEQRFSASRMAGDYLAVYERILGRSPLGQSLCSRRRSWI